MHWCLGVWGSGSTWVYNVVLQLAAALEPGRAVEGQFAILAGDLRPDPGPDVLVVVKTHEVEAADEARLARRASAIIMSLRDPRDATASLMTYMKHDFDAALARVANAAAACALRYDDPRTLVLRYEDRFTERPETLDRIAATFGRTLDDELRARLFAATRREAVESTIRAVTHLPRAVHNPQIGDVVDPVTQWHAHHAGRTGEIGRWRRELTPAQAEAVMRATERPMRVLYPAGWPAAPRADDRAAAVAALAEGGKRFGRARAPFIDPAVVGLPPPPAASPTPVRAGPARLCLNMIVRNEARIIERCLRAVAPYIDAWVICDTGSTDGTQDIVRAFFAAAGIPGELHAFPFVNFEQARNAALSRARASTLAFDYLLLTDADMELKVEDPAFRDHLTASSYRVLQRSGMSYWNTRLLRRDHRADYVGVTHEYIRMHDEMASLDTIWFRDHAEGSSRPEKFRRDVRLLCDDLVREPDNPRTHFYLAQTYKGERMWDEAIHHYRRRIELGGWREEMWYAQWQMAQCLRERGDVDGFVREALVAYQARPHRAEPLYDLAKHYRNAGMNELAALYAEEGLALPWPKQDALFIDDWVYAHGLAEEMSISGFYARRAARRARGAACAEALALGRDVPRATRDLARRNLCFYAQPAAELLPGFSVTAAPFAPPDDYRPMNPSIARWGDALWMIQRSVNYVMTPGGGYRTHDGGDVRTRNFLLRLNDGLAVEWAAEILPPADWPVARFSGVMGFEDCRLFAWGDALWCVATTRELTGEGWNEMVLARIDGAGGAGACRLADWRVLRPEGPRRTEKNWMPLVADGTLRFVYAADPTRIVDATGATLSEAPCLRALDHARGGSQAIAFDGGWLALVHEVQVFDGKRRYLHRFLHFDAAFRLGALSRAFFFLQNGVEYAAGLARHPDGERLLASFGVNDGESWIGSFTAADLGAALRPVEG